MTSTEPNRNVSARPDLPQTGRLLLNLLVRFEQREIILGDFEEGFKDYGEQYGVFQARRWFWREFFKSLPSFIITPVIAEGNMLKVNLRLAIRNLRKRKGYAFVNISGLGMGLASCLLILLFVRDELSYDRFHDMADRTYRVTMDAESTTGVDRFAALSARIGREIRAQYSEVEHLVRLSSWSPSIKQDGRYFYGDRFYFAEPDFFQLFDFPLRFGNPQSALEQPNSIVLTESMAEKYFGSIEVLGRTLTLNDSLLITITGVMGDARGPSHFNTDFLVSYETLQQIDPDREGWLSNLGFWTYLQLREDIKADAFETRIADLVQRNRQGGGLIVSLGLQPMTDIHLRSHLTGEIGPTGDLNAVYLFLAIAVFVLIIACFNFVNLTTARSFERAGEVGMRKVLGSHRGALVRQFLGESIVMSALGLAVGLAVVIAVLPTFNILAGKSLAIGTVLESSFAVYLVTLFLLVGVLAGAYPALVFSGFPMRSVLGVTFHATPKGALVRRSLVVFQFVISIALIGGTIVFMDQLDFIQNQDLGFEKERIVVIDARNLPADTMGEQVELIKEELRRNPSVQYVTTSNTIPGRGTWLQLYSAEGLRDDEPHRAQLIPIDEDYLETFGIEIVAGRDFSPEFKADQDNGALVNVALVEDVGWDSSEESIGKVIDFGAGDIRIVGVFRNFHQHGLQQTIDPMILAVYPPMYRNFFSVRLRTEDLAETLSELEQTWERLFPGRELVSFFLDADFERQYHSELRLTRISGAFALIAVLIACLGLFGLAAFTAQQRAREICIRKIHGASISNVLLLLLREFFGLVLGAIVIAAPLSYLAMTKYLESFPYRIDLDFRYFIVPGVIALFIAIASVSYQSLKAATTNPVDSLRYD